MEQWNRVSFKVTWLCDFCFLSTGMLNTIDMYNSVIWNSYSCIFCKAQMCIKKTIVSVVSSIMFERLDAKLYKASASRRELQNTVEEAVRLKLHLNRCRCKRVAIRGDLTTDISWAWNSSFKNGDIVAKTKRSVFILQLYWPAVMWQDKSAATSFASKALFL